MPKVRIHTTVSPETFRKIEELKKEHKTLSNIVEKAVSLLYNSESVKNVSDHDILLLSFVKELNFTLCAKDHYTALAERDTDRGCKREYAGNGCKVYLKEADK